ncbi:hypothetical protein PHMEG_0009855 [Phytophthora megakarya]|uniref:Uncharacterized protein n=1 Tax=Phytophthora megakarya TaxID=4795 RepID=A0A225WFR6_9STRA|nr:hypothetical protein PHMEG_0009855 [Phytophthora megakarya]
MTMYLKLNWDLETLADVPNAIERAKHISDVPRRLTRLHSLIVPDRSSQSIKIYPC